MKAHKSKKFFFLSVCLVSLSAGTVTAWADTTLRVRHDIEQCYQNRHHAADRRDFDGILAFLSPDFVCIYPNGSHQNYENTRRKLMDLFTYARTIRADDTIQTFALSGRRAVVRVSTHSVITYIPNQPVVRIPMLQGVSFSQDESQITTEEIWAVSQDTWVRSSSGWVVLTNHVLSERHTMRQGIPSASLTM